MGYNNLSEITVKTQEELDAIPKDFKGRIYIDGGTPYARIYVKKRYYMRVVAWDNSSVEAWDNSSVVAWDNSSVEASANAQITDMLQGAKIKISGNARIVYMPKNIFEFMDFYGVNHTKTKATFYKSVHKKSNGTYCSDHNKDYIYNIKQTYKEECDTDITQNCGEGLHIAHLDWALILVLIGPT